MTAAMDCRSSMPVPVELRAPTARTLRCDASRLDHGRGLCAVPRRVVRLHGGRDVLPERAGRTCETYGLLGTRGPSVPPWIAPWHAVAGHDGVALAPAARPHARAGRRHSRRDRAFA